MDRLTCAFAEKHFPLPTPVPSRSVPCHTSYHLKCFRAGVPFRTRLPKDGGLCLPANLTVLPNFICECCTVRAVLGRELNHGPEDTALLMLERLRLLDMIHNWAPGTHQGYQGKLNVIHQFERTFGCQVLARTTLDQPPTSPAIPTMWAQQHYSIQPTSWSRSADSGSAVTFATVRGLRSAVSQYYTWDYQVSHPGHALRDGNSRAILVNGCLPTDELSYAMMSNGMGRRLGEDSKPAKALLARHVKWIDAHLQRLYDMAPPGSQLAQQLCRAALVNTIAWLAWLRACETFGLRWCDIGLILPEDGPYHDLPLNVGALLLQLLPATKSSQNRTADVPIAYTSASGLSPGAWLLRLRTALGHPVDWSTDTSLLFSHADGTPWTSLFFRTSYLLPFLTAQQLEGDAYLRPYDGSPGNALADAFWSFHVYRSGGRTQVSIKRIDCRRKASKEEVSEHARWRVSRRAMDMPTLYLQWVLADRLAITVLCM